MNDPETPKPADRAMATAASNTPAATDSFSWRGFKTRQMRKVSPFVETFGRIGHVAKGVVYFVVGLLAFKLSIGGAGGEAGGSKNALREIGQQPFGQIMLWAMAIGLFAYTIWRVVEAVQDPENNGSDAKGIVKRVAYFISGISYALLGVYALSLVLPSMQSSSGDRTGPLLESTWGRVILGVIAACVLGHGMYQIVKGVKAKFMSKYNLADMSEKVRTALYHIGRVGLITRGIAILIIGFFFARSAYAGTNGGETPGMGDALSAIASAPFGKILIGVVGFGLMAYAIHMFAVAKYRAFKVK